MVREGHSPLRTFSMAASLEELAHQQASSWSGVGQRLGVGPTALTHAMSRLFRSIDERNDLLLVDGTSGIVRGVAARSVNPWTGLDEGFVYAMATPDEPAGAVQRVTDAARRLSAEIGITLWRAEIVSGTAESIAPALAAAGWLRHYDVVALRLPFATLDGTSEHVPEDIHLRPATEEDRGFVEDLLFRAVWDGLSADERAARPPDEIRLAVAAEYESGVAAGSTFSFVAVDGPERRLGHSTGRLQGPHPVLPLVEGELVDTYALPEASGRGVGGALTTLVLRELSARGAGVALGTVDLLHTPPDRLAAIRRQLDRTGWWRFSSFWYLVP